MTPLHKIYIASGLSNWKRVRGLWHEFAKYNVHATYDWTTHGEAIYGDGSDVQPAGIKTEEEMGQIGWEELVGVLEAQYLLVVLPGERGTHLELGAAYLQYAVRHSMIGEYDGYGVPMFNGHLPITILMGADTAARPTSFHYMRGVKRTTSEEEAVSHVLDHLGVSKDIIKGDDDGAAEEIDGSDAE